MSFYEQVVGTRDMVLTSLEYRPAFTELDKRLNSLGIKRGTEIYRPEADNNFDQR